VRYINAASVLGAQAETDLLAVTSANVTGSTSAALTKATLHASTKDDGAGGQARKLNIRVTEEACGDQAAANTKISIADTFKVVSVSGETICWELTLVNPDVGAGGISSTETFAETHLSLPDAIGLSTIECALTANPGEYSCVLYEVKTLTPAQATAQRDQVLETIEIVP
jgi:hypothetical protein